MNDAMTKSFADIETDSACRGVRRWGRFDKRSSKARRRPSLGADYGTEEGVGTAARVEVSNEELRTTGEAMRELRRLVDDLERGVAEKYVLTRNGRMLAVVVSVDYFAFLRRVPPQTESHSTIASHSPTPLLGLGWGAEHPVTPEEDEAFEFVERMRRLARPIGQSPDPMMTTPTESGGAPVE